MKAWGLVLMWVFYTATVEGKFLLPSFPFPTLTKKREGVRHKRHWLLGSLINLWAVKTLA